VCTKRRGGDAMELRHRIHEMTTAQESESSYHLHRNVRSISFGVEYATAFWKFPIEARAWRC
jgi:hypothetical protein